MGKARRAAWGMRPSAPGPTGERLQELGCRCSSGGTAPTTPCGQGRRCGCIHDADPGCSRPATRGLATAVEAWAACPCISQQHGVGWR